MHNNGTQRAKGEAEEIIHDARERTRYGSFLQSDFASFDNSIFRVVPAEAIALEPQQRLLLEVGYDALLRHG